MTYLSPILSIVALKFDNKGSIYGKAQSWSSYYSFQRSQGSSGSCNQNRIEVLSSKTTTLSTYMRSITETYVS